MTEQKMAPAKEAAPDNARRSLVDRYGGRIAQNALLVALILEVAFFSLFSAQFLTLNNFTNVAVQSSIIGLVAVPTALLLLTGYVDLSIGSTLALGAVVAGVTLVGGADPTLAVLAGVGAGLAVGLLNGALICLLGFSAIIVTLGGLTAIRGVALAVTDQSPTNFPDAFLRLGGGTLSGIPIPVVITGLAFLLGGLFLRYTVYGRYVYAIGVNPEATYLSGVSIRRIPFILFVLTGAAAGLGGTVLAARIGAAPPGTLGTGFELSVLTAVLLGGVAFGGGKGNIFGVLLGVLFLGILQNGLTLLNVPSTYSLIAQGSVLIVAAAFEYLGSRSR
jgi:ribose/xylose/arabinose/galactoside ABC-type transport system permease subunit